jgi:hypothetical protein
VAVSSLTGGAGAIPYLCGAVAASGVDMACILLSTKWTNLSR